MEYVIIFNGLGNQMSQYAFFLAKKKLNPQCRILIIDDKNSHNGYELDKVFGIRNKETFFDRIIKVLYLKFYRKHYCRWILNIINFHVVREALNYDYNPDNFKSINKGICLYWGGWHSEKNFINIREVVSKTFSFPEPINLDTEYFDVLNKIRQSYNSVFLHVRRGDYINIPSEDYYQFGGVATDDYYHKAVEYIKKKIDNPVFFIFSNDIDWCKNNLKLDHSTLVSCNQGKDSWRDMQLMSECRHHIMANSTFSWWGAWLSKHKGIIVHPRWFIRDVETKDFYPKRWISI